MNSEQAKEKIVKNFGNIGRSISMADFESLWKLYTIAVPGLPQDCVPCQAKKYSKQIKSNIAEWKKQSETAT